MSAVQIFVTGDALAADALQLILQAASEAIAARGCFTIALTGGSSPVTTYELLAQASPELARWDQWQVFLGDDRFVPIATDAASPEAAAEQYAETLIRVLRPAPGQPPVFDLILLGLGDDGHCASLFPHMPTLDVVDRWVVSSPPGTLPPPVDRVTVTYPVLNAARQVLFLVSGEKKAAPVRDILEGGAVRAVHPAAGVRPVSGTLTWMLDSSAAALLTHRQESAA
jgi:6-phosphogluconolactonase